MKNLFFIFFTIVLFNSCEKEPFNAWPASPCFKWEETTESRIPNFCPSGLEVGKEYRIYCEYDTDTTSFGTLSNVATQFVYDVDTDVEGIINYLTCEQEWIVSQAQTAYYVFYECDKYGHIVERTARWRNPSNGAWNSSAEFSLKVKLIL